MLIVLMLLLSLLFPHRISAIDEFTTRQTIEYRLDTTTTASVEHRIEVINNFSNIYAKEYQFKLSGVNIDNLIATDTSGNNVLRSQSTEGSNTKINLVSKDPVVGKNKTQVYLLKYKVDNFVQIKGKLFEITLPQYSQINQSDLIEITIRSPVSNGNLSFSSITPSSQNQQNGFNVISFQLTHQSNGKKILLAFGSAQIFDFDLDYYLQNNDNNAKIFTIPIPPDTNNQKITLKSIVPPPRNIQADNDGNWMAEFQLNPNESTTIKVQGQAKILPLPQTMPPDSQEYLDSLTAASTYWHPDSPAITQISAKLNNPRQIYDYVVSSLSYDFNKLSNPSRMGDLYALSNPQKSLCTEFTDLFVSLARSKKISAREIEGFAYSNNEKIKPVNPNSDILHAWPQYYDPAKGWVSIDPTWEKTTNGIDYFDDLDLNHLVFVIHGQNAESPLPPGSYKKDNLNRTVRVTFASEETSPTHIPLIVKSNIKHKNTYKLFNPNPYAVYGVKIESPKLNWIVSKTILPPYSSSEIPVPQISFLTSIFPVNQKTGISISSDNFPSAQTSIIYLPHYLNLGIVIFFTIFLLSLGGIIITKSKSK